MYLCMFTCLDILVQICDHREEMNLVLLSVHTLHFVTAVIPSHRPVSPRTLLSDSLLARVTVGLIPRCAPGHRQVCRGSFCAKSSFMRNDRAGIWTQVS